MRSDNGLKPDITCQAMLHCMQQLIQSEAPCAKQYCRHACRCRFEARHCVLSDAAAMCAAIAYLNQGRMSQAVLRPGAPPLILKRGIPCQAMLHDIACSHCYEARHHVPPRDAAAMRAAIGSKRGTTCPAMLRPCVPPLIVKRGITCQAMLHACST